MQKVIILTDDYPVKLQTRVNEKLADGYRLEGPVQIAITPGGNREYVATVVRDV